MAAPFVTSPELPTVVVLASGRGERFIASGGSTHKLKALLAGKPLLQHTLDAVKASGLPWHLEDAGHPGMGDSIAAGVRATSGAAGWMILQATCHWCRRARCAHWPPPSLATTWWRRFTKDGADTQCASRAVLGRR